MFPKTHFNTEKTQCYIQTSKHNTIKNTPYKKSQNPFELQTKTRRQSQNPTGKWKCRWRNSDEQYKVASSLGWSSMLVGTIFCVSL